jgi:hypothetical protein
MAKNRNGNGGNQWLISEICLSASSANEEMMASAENESENENINGLSEISINQCQ